MSGLGNIATDKNNFRIITNKQKTQWYTIRIKQVFSVQITNNVVILFRKSFLLFLFPFVRNIGLIECSRVVKFDDRGPWRTFILICVPFFFFIMGCCASHVNKIRPKNKNAPKLEWTIQPSGIFFRIFGTYSIRIEHWYTTRLASNLIYWLYGHGYNIMGCYNVSRLHFISKHQTDATCFV